MDYAAARMRMVDEQIAGRGISDPRVLAAMRSVPREQFVPQGFRTHAYDDSALPIEAGQTISQPFIVALMIEAAAVAPADRVLEIGAGSGYAAAILGHLGAEVFTVERHAELADLAAARMRALGLGNVSVRRGDGSLGLPDLAPFNAILVPAASDRIPPPLKAQLSDGGRLVMPIGASAYQQLIKLTLRDTRCAEEQLGEVRFVPLIGKAGGNAVAAQTLMQAKETRHG